MERGSLRELDIEGELKFDIKKIGCEVMDWIKLDELRIQWWDLVNTVTKIRVP
jgi:hypothetical protein